ncbi:MAG: mechanosensitive ion channel family protein, partial [Candidatus Woesearchaeota archaeon]
AQFKWYEKEIAIKTKSDIDDRYLHIIRRGINILIFVIAVLITLAKLGIEITPLLAGLGIGGLAVALALQDSLSNFFSGVYTMTDRSIKIGDYIETDSNIKGIIKDISWRTAKIQQLDGNLVIVPNSKLAQSIVTNYDAIDKSMALVVPVGVSYDSDLDKVERITIKVAKEVLRDKNQLPKNFEPVVRYTQFADFSINFNVILKINDFSQRFTVKHEFIKRLKKEYDKNKIEIPFPIRTIYMKK